jgi:hypothetical protein
MSHSLDLAGELILAPRDPSRAKAADIPDDLILQVVDAHVTGGLFPTDALKQYPAKCVIAKLRKAEQRGWIVKANRHRWALTPAGRAVLTGEAA